MQYSINPSLSKEENLELAKQYEDKAKSYLERFNELLKEANKDFPVGITFGMSKAKIDKSKTPNEVYDRLYSASRSLYNTKSTYEMRERMEKEKIEKERQAELLKQRELEKSSLVNDAIAYCLANGRTFGERGFTIDTAIQIANDIAFDKEVARKEEEIGDGHTGFSGMNCEDECAGWNPKHHRCECGNRRVSWTNDYSNFKDMEIYAEAY
jgi:hypothetical protein